MLFVCLLAAQSRLWLWTGYPTLVLVKSAAACYHFGIQKPIFRPPANTDRSFRSNNNSFLLLLLICGDICPNPGPVSDFLPGADLSFASNYSESSSDCSVSHPIPTGSSLQPLFFSINVNGLLSKLPNLHAIVSSYHPAVLCLQETKLSASISSAELSIPGYSLFRKDRLRNGGGVAIYALTSLNPHQCSRGSPRATDDAKWECISVSLSFRRTCLTAISAYFSPANSVSSWSDFVSQISDFVAARDFSRIILCGDLNHCASCPSEYSLLQGLCSAFNLKQLVDVPTHVTASSVRIIDLVFMGDQLFSNQHGITSPVESTHSVVWFQIDCPKPPELSRSFNVWLWDDADWDKVSFQLGYLPNGDPRPWVNEIWSHSSAEAAVADFSQKLRDVFRQCIPQKTVKIRGSAGAGWFNRGIKLLICRRDRAYSAYKANPNSKLFAKFKSLQRHVKIQVRSAKRQFVFESFQDVSSVGDFWKAFRRVSGSAAISLPPLQLPDGSYVSKDSSKASVLSSEFCSNFNSLAEPSSPLSSNIPLDAEHLCSLDFVVDWLLNLQQNAATGLDGIPARFLKGALPDICQPLHCLLNRCLLEGHFPTEWKLAKIVPIPKIHGSASVSNFRPVSILSILSKLGESWLLSCLLPWLQPSRQQFGFWPGRSTEDAVAYIQSIISSSMQKCLKHKNPPKVALISFDIRRAFDQVCHKSLLQVLQQRGVPVPLLRILHSYLCQRKQVVSANGSLSSAKTCSSGVPQGSILGGYLFNIYIDAVFDLNLSPGAFTAGYADDLVLIKPIFGSASLLELQSDINCINAFYKLRLLSIQPSKCSALICSIAPRPLSLGNPLLIDGVPITFVSELKYLGVLFDRKLDFSRNAEAASTSSRRVLGSLRRSLFPLLGKQAFSRLYSAKIVPILTYCISVAAPSHKTSFSALEKVHRLAARYISNDWKSSYLSLLSRLHWKSISQLCFERRAFLCFKYIHNLRHRPPALINFVQPTERQKMLRHRPHDLDLIIPKSSRSSIDLLPLWNCFHTWNALAKEIKSCSTISIFKAAIRNFGNYRFTQANIPERLLFFDSL